MHSKGTHLAIRSGRASYIRITEIEITTPEGKTIKVSDVQKRGMYEKVYPRKTYTFTFVDPVRIKAMKISISHETNGLKVWTVPVGKIAPPPMH